MTQNMTWESRQGRGSYFTHTIRVGKSFRRLYFGNGVAAALAAIELEVERRRQVNDRWKRERWWRELRAIDRHARHLQRHLLRFHDMPLLPEEINDESAQTEEGNSDQPQ